MPRTLIHLLVRLQQVDPEKLSWSQAIWIKLRGDNIGQPTDAPLATISAGGLHHAEVRAFLIKYYGNEKDGFLPTETDAIRFQRRIVSALWR